MNKLLEALAVDSDENQFDDDNSDDVDQSLIYENMLQFFQIIECCKSLVLYEKSSELMKFTHYTVQEFIANHIQQNLSLIIDLTKTCLIYFAFDQFGDICSN